MLRFCYILLQIVTMLTISELRHHCDIITTLSRQHTPDILTYPSTREQNVNLLIHKEKKFWKMQNNRPSHAVFHSHAHAYVLPTIPSDYRNAFEHETNTNVLCAIALRIALRNYLPIWVEIPSKVDKNR